MEKKTKPTKKYEKLNCKIDKEIADRLEQFVLQTRFTKTATVENALEYYFDHYNISEQLRHVD